MSLVYKIKLKFRIKDRINNIILLLSKNIIILFNNIYKKKIYNKINLKKPILDIDKYKKIANESKKITSSEINHFEETLGFKIDKNWIDNLALRTTIEIKKSGINYSHGRILYTSLRNYIKLNYGKLNHINIIETGTARGFSSLCMAKALNDSNSSGTILTFDIVPNKISRFWNCIIDHELGPTTRQELLEPYKELVNKYIIFLEGDTKIELPKILIPRINFAFIDGSHTYDDVMFEFNLIKDCQKEGDLIIFDDYNNILFPGIVKAVDEICKNFYYDKKIIKSIYGNQYVITTKI